MTDKQAKRLKIGCEVLVSATTEMLYVPEYEESPVLYHTNADMDWLASVSKGPKRQVRTPVKTPVPDEKGPIRAIVTGAKNAPVGEYCPASGGHSFGEDDFEPPSLSQTGTVLLIRVRTRLLGRDTWAQAEDLELVEPAGGSSCI